MEHYRIKLKKGKVVLSKFFMQQPLIDEGLVLVDPIEHRFSKGPNGRKNKSLKAFQFYSLPYYPRAHRGAHSFSVGLMKRCSKAVPIHLPSPRHGFESRKKPAVHICTEEKHPSHQEETKAKHYPHTHCAHLHA